MKNKNAEILVLGSVVRDVVFLPSNRKKEFFGGTGANIAYGLGMLGLGTALFSVVGGDFSSTIKKHLSKYNVILKFQIYTKDKNAVFTLDKRIKNKTKEVWEPNIYSKIEDVSLEKTLNQIPNKVDIDNIKIAIFSPGTPKSTVRHLKEFKKINKKALVIFDPGQMTYSYSKKMFEDCLKYSNWCILNEVESKHIEKILKIDRKKYLKDKIFIKTLGEKGSEIYVENKIYKIPVTKTEKFIDATGAGDAYRAGLIFGLIKGLNVVDSAKLGSKIAAKCVEYLGCQKYTFKVLLED